VKERPDRRQLPITGNAHKAAVVRDPAVIAAVTCLDMAAKRRGPAQLDRLHDSPFDVAKVPVMGDPVSRAVAAEYIRHLQSRAHSDVLSWVAPRPG